MSAIKDERIPLKIGKNTYMIMLSLNLIDIFQDRYGDLEKLINEFQNTQALKWIIMQFVNEAIDNHNDENPHDKWQYVDEKWIGRNISVFDDIVRIRDILLMAFKVSLPEPKDEEIIDPNQMTTM